MPRRKCCRKIGGTPVCRVFKPVGVPVVALDEVVLAVDEFEAIRLADDEGLYQEEAAVRMNVSRQTFGRILEAARRKVARVLVDGLVLRIGGDEAEPVESPTFQCMECRSSWSESLENGGPDECPACKSRNFCRSGERAPVDGFDGGCPRGRCPKP